MIRFTVPGKPMGKQRPFVTRQGRAFTRKETVEYEEHVRRCLREQCGEVEAIEKGVPVRVEILAYFPVPKSVSKKRRAEMASGEERPVVKPDFDNIGKIICDSLNGVAYRDDAQVVVGNVEKWYSEDPRVEVEVRRWNNEV